MEDKKVIDVEPVNKPTLEEGNYIIEVISKGEILKKIAVANAEVNISKLAEGGLAVDLK